MFTVLSKIFSSTALPAETEKTALGWIRLDPHLRGAEKAERSMNTNRE